MRTEQEMLDTVVKIAENDERIRAVYLYGSRANPEAEKDEFQDYDVAFVVTETESFQADKNWFSAFGDIAVFNEGDRNNLLYLRKEDMSVLSRRCIINILFKDFISLDLIIEVKEEAIKDFVTYQPAKILVDKDIFLSGIIISTDNRNAILKPSQEVFSACCSFFWWFMVTPAKNTARNNIPFAMSFFNSLERQLLNQMIEWYIGVLTDFSAILGNREKYYKKYLTEELYDLYSRTYTDKDYWNIIFTACDLFHKLAFAVGTHFNFAYNQQEEDSMIQYLQKIKNDCSK